MRFTHQQLSAMSQPASDTEEEKLDRARKQVFDAIKDTQVAKTCDVFGKGSYHNNTNIRLNSDIDICVCYRPTFKFRLPNGDHPKNHDIDVVSETYTYDKFKQDLYQILTDKFGKDNVVLKNKCIHVKENTYHSELDVVPSWYHRSYLASNSNNYNEGVILWTPSGESVLNYPKQHYNNGVAKNRTTRKRYKCLVRIIKNLKVKMAEDGYYVNENVSSFLLESLVYNFPNSKFLYDEDIYDWNDIIRSFIISFWNGSKEDKNDWKTWTEVSGLLPLMSNHKWKREDVHEFMLKLWNYLQYSTK